MSTFNLNEAVRSGRLTVKTACQGQCQHAKEGGKPVDTCPQCDGFGMEDNSKGIPMACRRCGGTGTVDRITKVASASREENLMRKTAAGDTGMDDQDDQVDQGDDSTPSEEAFFGIDGKPSAPSPDLSDDKLRGEIGAFFEPMSPQMTLSAFEVMCDLLGLPTDERGRHSRGPDGQQSVGKVKDFMYGTLDKMNSQQLRALDARIRKMMFE